ncbi:sigma-70 family RNA polymerase sigma factor [Actinoplanes solisilvae]|uniref:sigma-70 family RNA polymerase sigma factor n=1 Tax=Actinoplanes solisilvae TaxID=2486853 RepID=UPI001F0C74CA|nr:sigma-70 family RNA polymerase sigma factor [Actinoplanes solisilvae]
MAPTATASARLTEVHQEYSTALLSYLSGFTASSRQSAEDLLQETMIRVWRKVEDLPPDTEGTRRWLFTVARNVGIDAVRRTRVRPVGVELIESMAGPGGDDITETVVAMESLRVALHSLSRTHQRILAELYLEGHSTRETAQRLGVPVGTVKSRAFYALQSLRSAMDPPDANDRPRPGRARRDGRPAAGPGR